MITILTANFNTQELTDCMLRSLQRNISQPVAIYVMDNSDKTHYAAPTQGNISVIDNTSKKYKGSEGHCESIEDAFNQIDADWLILVDNDVLFLKPIDNLIKMTVNCGYDICGEVGHDVLPQDRLFPYFCIINLKRIKELGIHYYRKDSIVKGVADTGASFLQDCLASKLKIKRIKLDNYILHLKNGSFGKKNYKQWLNINKHLWK